MEQRTIMSPLSCYSCMWRVKIKWIVFTWPNTPRLEATRLVIKLVVVLYITPFAQRIEKCFRVLWPCTPLLVLVLSL